MRFPGAMAAVLVRIAASAALGGCAAHGAPAVPAGDLPAFLAGADVSFLPQVEAAGGTYRDAAGARDALAILRDHGINFVRLRLWHAPADDVCGLGQTVAMARRAKVLGLGVLLDIHYSDTWADPGKQTKPAAWADLDFAELERAVHDYTAEVVGALREQGVTPDIVQIGNEITGGMLWEDGRVNGGGGANWPRLAALLGAGARAVVESAPAGERPRILIHLDAGGNNAVCRAFFDRAVAEGVPFDFIGVSYYPWWHGTLEDLRANVADLVTRYGKPVMVVETAYPWTLEWRDNTHNQVGVSGQILPPYAASEEGQRAFLSAEISLLKDAAGGRRTGVFYWAPDWLAAPGLGSAWENLTLFDFGGRALGGLDAFAHSR